MLNCVSGGICNLPEILLQVDAHRLDSHLSVVLAVVVLWRHGTGPTILLIVQFREDLLVQVRVTFYVLRIHVIIWVLVASQSVLCCCCCSPPVKDMGVE